MTRYRLQKLYPELKPWKNNFHAKKPWKLQGITWGQWREHQADLAVEYYSQNFRKVSRVEASAKFGISLNIFDRNWKWYKRENNLIFNHVTGGYDNA